MIMRKSSTSAPWYLILLVPNTIDFILENYFQMDAAAAMSSATNRKLLSFKETYLHACFIERDG